ncbi:mannose-1-phosphate guanylyltransferase [bacterium]|nr:mannose-1-phosphate guanylyltransferase [bacterium]
MLHAVIMAGGSGTRFWPLSRTATPKQLLPLAGDQSMIQQAYARCSGLVDPQCVWVVTNAKQIEATRAQLPEIPDDHFLVEPAARNTAPCIGLAAIHILKNDPEAEMLVMPADHVIGPVQAFQKCVQTAQSLIQQDSERLTLFGVPPTFPSTGFGYIERGALVDESVPGAFDVRSFREKPDHETAEVYLERGDFFWNCGIFVWRADTILRRIEASQPGIAEPLRELVGALGAGNYEAKLAELFPQCTSISIDYAVLEQGDRIAVVEAEFDWDDVGSWQALHRLRGVDEAGNTIVGEHLGVDTQDCVVRSVDGHVIATLGVKNCIVVHTPDVTLVADKQDENAIKSLIEAARDRGLDHLL